MRVLLTPFATGKPQARGLEERPRSRTRSSRAPWATKGLAPHKVVALLIALAFASSGCLSVEPPDAGSGPGAALTLDDLRRCAFEYPDGSPVPCENQATPLSLETEPPSTTWLCVEKVGDDSQGFLVYQNLAADEWGIEYRAPPISTLVSGTIQVGSPDALRLYNWSGGGRTAFLRIGGVPAAGAPVTVSVYHMGYSADPADLQGGLLEQLWSLYEGKSWAFHRLQVAESTYFFMQIVQFNSYYHLSNADYHGDGFNVSLSYEKGFTGATEFRGGRPVPGFTPNCPL